MPNEKEQEYFHEALDRAHMVSSHLQMALAEHETIEKHEDIREAYGLAVEKLENLYQLIARKMG